MCNTDVTPQIGKRPVRRLLVLVASMTGSATYLLIEALLQASLSHYYDQVLALVRGVVH